MQIPAFTLFFALDECLKPVAVHGALSGGAREVGQGSGLAVMPLKTGVE
ncbi:MAG: hypothetical protein IOB85_04125 [Methylobacterium sp.]|nr:hypothetical protein [Methylobacterium sp.]MCA3657364.1 hypothetical protein [Methylobacterium sp.]MCA3670947.1 hypothetical protein [Methylobacterium sp.]MCA3677574.1 hypothetical protein [Methylobacterium sp.]MCA3680122.1 hypothetical protein [Methylobacterium sp.]